MGGWVGSDGYQGGLSTLAGGLDKSIKSIKIRRTFIKHDGIERLVGEVCACVFKWVGAYGTVGGRIVHW